MAKSQTPLTLGWEAARANAKPALIIQAIMLALAIAYYTNPATADALRNSCRIQTRARIAVCDRGVGCRPAR